MTPAILKAVCEEIVQGLGVQLAALKRGLDELRADLGAIPAGAPGAPGVGIKSVAQSADHSTAELELDNGQVIELQLPAGPKGEPGQPGEGIKGAPGAPGVGIKSVAQSVDRSTAELELDNGQVIELQLPAGPKGEPGQPGEGIKGDPGDDGQAPSADDVAAVLRASPDFIQAATPQAMQAQAWQPGIYRKGVAVSHYIGRTYCAEQDTIAEPGDSPEWRRLGTQGLRHIGGFAEARSYEAGDLYAKNGSTFLFDGAQHRLLLQRPYTPADAEKAAKDTGKTIAALRTELAEMSRELVETQAQAQLNQQELARILELLKGLE